MLKKICGFLSTILLIVLFALAVLLIGPNLLGMKSFAVLSGSMEPKIPVGSIVFVDEVEPATLHRFLFRRWLERRRCMCHILAT